jgi:hypothetical protein
MIAIAMLNDSDNICISCYRLIHVVAIIPFLGNLYVLSVVFGSLSQARISRADAEARARRC